MKKICPKEGRLFLFEKTRGKPNKQNNEKSLNAGINRPLLDGNSMSYQKQPLILKVSRPGSQKRIPVTPDVDPRRVSKSKDTDSRQGRIQGKKPPISHNTPKG